MGFILILTIYTTTYFFIEINPKLREVRSSMVIYNHESDNHKLLQSIVIQYSHNFSFSRMVGHQFAVSYIDSGFRYYWHLLGLHWQLWVSLIFSEDEIYGLWLGQVNLKGRGLQSAALYYFNQDFDSLPCKQVVQLAMFVRQPSLMYPNSKRSDRYIQKYDVYSVCGS